MRPNSYEGARQPSRVRRYPPPEKLEIAGCQRCDFMHFGGQSVTENELSMIIKLDVNIIFFLKRLSLLGSIYSNLRTNFNDWNRRLHTFDFTAGEILPFF